MGIEYSVFSVQCQYQVRIIEEHKRHTRLVSVVESHPQEDRMDFVLERSYRGPLKAVILDWAGVFSRRSHGHAV
jgi:hypothetical protein